MFRLTGFCLVLILLVNQTYAQFHYHETETTGPKPVAIYGKDLNVFCLGNDGGEWGIKDSGDTDPSWRRVMPIEVPTVIQSPLSEGEVIRKFDFNTLYFPFRPGVDKNQENIFMRVGDSIQWFKLSTGELIDDDVLEVPAVSIQVFQSKLYICVANGGEKGSLLIQDIKTKDVIDTLVTGINPVDCRIYLSDGKERIAVLSSGPYGEAKSSLQIFEKNEADEFISFITIDSIGKDANHLNYFNNMLAASMNGSHSVVIANASTGEILKTVLLPTTGWDGPRETHILPNEQLFMTTAFDGNIYLYNPFKSEDIMKVESDGKPEGIYVDDNGVYVCNPFKKGTYDPDSTVSKFGTTSDVNEQYETLSKVKIYPNPAFPGNNVKIDLSNGFSELKSISIYDPEGKLIRRFDHQEINGDELIIDPLLLGLHSGTYYIKAATNHLSKTIPLTMIK